MMKRLRFLLILAMIPGLFCCEKGNDGDDITELNIELSKSKILNDGADKVEIVVLDQNNNNVTSEVSIYANQQILTGSTFTSMETGTYLIHAEYKNITSNYVEVTVVEDVGLKFEKKVLVEQFTGTWCGWCPRAIYDIKTLMEADSAVIHIGYHLEDELSYGLNFSLYNSMGYEYVPVVSADRSKTWEGDISEIAQMHIPQRLGIGLSVEGDCNGLDVTVRLKFGKIFTEELALSVYVVHDSLVADQVNYYNDDPSSYWYQQGATMEDFVHGNVMVKTATDLFGDPVPANSIDIGSIYEKTFSVSSFKCVDINHIKVVAFVTYLEGSNEKSVLNSMVCPQGESRDFKMAVE